MKNFILVGAAGYIAPRHLKAIKAVSGNLIAAFDPHDAVGILDSYFPETKFFVEFERFDRFINKYLSNNGRIDYLTICTPNHSHDFYIRYGLKLGIDVICEKPAVLNLWNLESLINFERTSNSCVFNILQLRLHPSIQKLKEEILHQTNKSKLVIDLKYYTSRGNWYFSSWKGDINKSGGLSTNIGIHFFDMLYWIFGDIQDVIVNSSNKKTIKGILELELATVNWDLSIDEKKIPNSVKLLGQRTYRSITINNKELEFSKGFDNLHDISYKEIINGNGFRLSDVKKSIEIVTKIREYEK